MCLDTVLDRLRARYFARRWCSHSGTGGNCDACAAKNFRELTDIFMNLPSAPHPEFAESINFLPRSGLGACVANTPNFFKFEARGDKCDDFPLSLGQLSCTRGSEKIPCSEELCEPGAAVTSARCGCAYGPHELLVRIFLAYNSFRADTPEFSKYGRRCSTSNDHDGSGRMRLEKRFNEGGSLQALVWHMEVSQDDVAADVFKHTKQ